MNVLIAPDKFKGSLTAWEVCQAIEAGLLSTGRKMNITRIPLADGGEGSLEVLDRYLNLETITLTVSDPLFRPLRASYKIAGDRAYIEMARASGLDLLAPEERNCLHTTSLGTGQMALDAYKRGARHIYLFIGGSATNDGGIGFLKGMGIEPMKGGHAVSPVGKSLIEITAFDLSNAEVPLGEVEFTVVCDVRNPLYGPQGAACVYGPQKGADATAVELLDKGLQHFAQVIERQQNRSIHSFPGSGAAGGIAAGIKAFFPGRIQPGIESIMEMVKLPQAVKDADLVITGEGKFDHQTLQGKVISGVHAQCQKYQKKLAVICGSLSLTPQELKPMNIWRVMPLVTKDIDLDTAINSAYQLVSQRAYQLLEEFK